MRRPPFDVVDRCTHCYRATCSKCTVEMLKSHTTWCSRVKSLLSSVKPKRWSKAIRNGFQAGEKARLVNVLDGWREPIDLAGQLVYWAVHCFVARVVDKNEANLRTALGQYGRICEELWLLNLAMKTYDDCLAIERSLFGDKSKNSSPTWKYFITNVLCVFKKCYNIKLN